MRLGGGAGDFLGALGPNHTAEFTATVTVLGGTEGDWRWQVRPTPRRGVRGLNWNNNLGESPALTQLQVPASATAVESAFRAGQPAY
jgi:hypothetical protein